MLHSQTSLRVAGIWLALGSLLLAGSLVFHGPPATHMDAQMKVIADGAIRWVVVHWAAAAALSLFAVAGLVLLAAASRLTHAEGKATGFIFLALAVAVIAGNETRTSRATPVWASWMAVVAGVASFAGWVLGMWLDIAPGNLVWVISSLVMCLWTLWFGVAIARAGEPAKGLGE